MTYMGFKTTIVNGVPVWEYGKFDDPDEQWLFDNWSNKNLTKEEKKKRERLFNEKMTAYMKADWERMVKREEYMKEWRKSMNKQIREQLNKKQP